MVGTVVRRKRGDRALFRVIGRDGGQWVIGPEEEFGPALNVSELELRELYAVVSASDAPAAPEPSVRVLGMTDTEVSGREHLRAQMARQAAGRAREPQGRTPEQVFDAARLGPQGK